MPISKKHNLLFVHIPKNAGSSMAKLIGAYPDDRHEFNSETLYGIDPKNQLVLQTMPYKFFKNYIPNIDKFTKFTVTRNPYDRFLSDYCWDTRRFKSPLEYAQFIKYNLDVNPWDELLKHNSFHSNHILPQWYYLSNEDGSFNKDIKLLKLENIQTEASFIEGIVEDSFPHINKTKKRLEIKDLDSATVKIINEIYERDFIELGYQKLSPNFPTFLRLVDNKIYSNGITPKLGWPKENGYRIPDEYLQKGEFMIMRLCNGLGDWGIISALPRMLKEKYPHCKVYLPSEKMVTSILGNGWQHWPNPEKNVKRIFQNNPYVDGFVDDIPGEVYHDHFRIYDKEHTSLVKQMLLFWGFSEEECINYEPELYFTDSEKEKGDAIIKEYFGTDDFGGFICSNSQLEKGKFWEDERDTSIIKTLKQHPLNYVYYGGVGITPDQTPFGDYLKVVLDLSQFDLRTQLYIRSKAKVNIGYQSSIFEIVCRYTKVICTQMDGGARENMFNTITYI